MNSVIVVTTQLSFWPFLVTFGPCALEHQQILYLGIGIITGHRNTSFGFFKTFIVAVVVALMWMVRWANLPTLFAGGHPRHGCAWTWHRTHEPFAAEYRGHYLAGLYDGGYVYWSLRCLQERQTAWSAFPSAVSSHSSTAIDWTLWIALLTYNHAASFHVLTN
jgi:hypothetical protein